MTQAVYKELLAVMQKRGGFYAGMDIPEFYDLVEFLFTPEEAEVNNAMPRGLFAARDLAGQMGRDEERVTATLEDMADKGLCLAFKEGDAHFYKSAGFMPGILEFQCMTGKTGDREKKIAKLIWAYKKAFDALEGKTGSFHHTRTITVDSMIRPGETVHTYDQVQTYIDKYAPIAVTSCYCRHAAVLRGEDVHGLPMDVCMQFGPFAQLSHRKAQRPGAEQRGGQGRAGPGRRGRTHPHEHEHDGGHLVSLQLRPVALRCSCPGPCQRKTRPGVQFRFRSSV